MPEWLGVVDELNMIKAKNALLEERK